MTLATELHVAPAVNPAVRKAGLVCFVAGLLGAASGLFLLLVEPQVPDTRFSYPLTATAFITIQVWFVVQHGGLIAGQVGLWASGVAGRSRTTAVGHVVGIAGMALLTVTELVAVAAAEDPYPSPTTDVLDVMYGVASIAIGVGLLLVGVAVRREGAWVGWRRWVVLALGAWVFVPMTPAIMAGFAPARLGITGWMLLFAALGWALAVPRSPAPGGSCWRMKAAAGWITVLLGLGFGIPCAFGIRHFAQTGEVWTFLGFPTYGGGPFERAGLQTTTPLLVGFLVVCVAQVVVGALLVGGASYAPVLFWVLLPFSLVFWIGFALPFGPLLGLVAAGLLLFSG